MKASQLCRSLALAAPLILATATAAYAQNPQPRNAQNPPQQGQQGAPAERPPEQNPEPPIPAGPPLPTVSLESLVERVAKSSKKQFLLDPRAARQQVYLGSMRPEDVNYPTLLSILRIYGMAAATIEGRVNIVPDNLARFLPTPLVQSDDSSIPADEWVARVITTTKKEASWMVPILRPMLPQAAHLAAMCGTCEPGAQSCTNCRQLIVKDRYANVQLITSIVRVLDQ